MTEHTVLFNAAPSRSVTMVHHRKTRDCDNVETTHVYPLSDRQVAALMSYIDHRIELGVCLALGRPVPHPEVTYDDHRAEVIAILQGDQL